MIKKLQALRAKKGFTLVELIVVIAIIGVLAAILIPTLSGVIESSRKRSAESTCQSIQSLAKTYASQYLANKGSGYTGAAGEKVDMDEDGIGETTMNEYILRQIPEMNDTAKYSAAITLANGQVTGVQYKEGDFFAEWNSTDGMKSAVKDATKTPTGTITITPSVTP